MTTFLIMLFFFIMISVKLYHPDILFYPTKVCQNEFDYFWFF